MEAQGDAERKIVKITADEKPIEFRVQPRSRLYIPFGKDVSKSVAWRMRLLKKVRLCDPELIKTAFDKTNPSKLTARKQIVDLALSDKIRIDPIERLFLFLATLFLQVDKFDSAGVISLSRKDVRLAAFGNLTLEEYALKNPGVVEFTRRTIRILGDKILYSQGAKIRAKVALLEIAAIFSPDEIVLILLELSPKYLGCDFVQCWVRSQQKSILKGVADRRKARQNLMKIGSALAGDGRRFKQVRYPYWQLDFIYRDLCEWIFRFREEKTSGSLDRPFFDQFFEAYKIPTCFKNLVLSRKPTASELALEIMIAQGRIKTPKSFRTFQAEVNKLKAKHEGIEFMTGLENFLDLPTLNPARLESIEYLQLLEGIDLNLIPTDL